MEFSFDISFLTFTTLTAYFMVMRAAGTIFWVSWLASLQHQGETLTYIEWGPFVSKFIIQYPDWFVEPTTVGLFGVLALFEHVAETDPDIQAAYAPLAPKIKSCVQWINTHLVSISLVVQVGVLVSSQPEVMHAGWGFGTIWGLFLAVGVWFLSMIRQEFWDFICEIDDDGSLGLRKLLGWAENGWVAGGVVLAVFAPLLILILAAFSVLILKLINYYFDHQEKKARVPCSQCGQPNHPGAITCCSCNYRFPRPKKIGFFGQVLKTEITDLRRHSLSLSRLRRCGACATKLPKRKLQQTCPGCGRTMFSNKVAVDAYLGFVQESLGKTLLVSFFLSLVPVIGVIPGVLYYRLCLIGSLRRYVQPADGCFGRWLIRFCVLIVLSMQWIPGIGSISLPIICLINYSVYKRILKTRQSKIKEG